MEVKIDSPIDSLEFRVRKIQEIMDGLTTPTPSHVGPDGKLLKENELAEVRGKLGNLAVLDYLGGESEIMGGLKHLWIITHH